MKRKRNILLISALVFAVGLGLVLYPVIHGQSLQRGQTEEATAFRAQVERWQAPDSGTADPEDPGPYPELREAMESYNARLFDEYQVDFNSPEAYEQVSFTLADYGLDSEVFGVLSIPALELEMPLYLGANRENLARGAAHLSQTSLPIGGENTNCVIAGHRGWQGGEYFLRLHKLQAGDTVEVTNLWETLTYQVREVTTIEPTDSDAVRIREDEDLLTLLTCEYSLSGTKYRYLVICERVV